LSLAQPKKESNDLPNISNDFIHDDKQFLTTQKIPRHKKGGPYSKSERRAKQKEEFRVKQEEKLHAKQEEEYREKQEEDSLKI